MKKKWISRKVYNITKENLMSCCDDKGIIDVNTFYQKFDIPIRIIKAHCRNHKLKFKDCNTIQCPVCSWSGNFRFSTHILKSQDIEHKNWLEKLKRLYNELNSCNKISILDEIRKYNISSTVVERLLNELKELKKNNFIETKCPVCEWEGFYHFPKHIRTSLDEKHEKFKLDLKNKYIEEKMSDWMIGSFYHISASSVSRILKDLNVKTRNHHEAIVNAIKQNRHNINAYGIGGFRRDLNGYYRSMSEANFARILKFEKIEFEHEVAFDLYENGKLITTYFLDFLVNKRQGFEIKSYKTKNNDFKNREKIILFTKQHPEIKLKVLFCDSEEWKEISEKYLKLIPLWETSSRNLKTNPELYS